MREQRVYLCARADRFLHGAVCRYSAEEVSKPGLADPEVIILDPACGTERFAVVFKEIYRKFQEKPDY